MTISQESIPHETWKTMSFAHQARTAEANNGVPPENVPPTVERTGAPLGRNKIYDSVLAHDSQVPEAFHISLPSEEVAL